METRDVNLTIDEIDLAIEGLEIIYLRKVRKAHLMPKEPRSVKVTEELSFCQVLMQKLMAIRNYDQEEIDAIAGRGTLGREEAKGASGT